MVKCSSCGERLSPRAKFCDYCGQPQKTPRPPPLPPAGESRTKTGSELQEKFCFACGEKINSRAEICPYCGVRQQDVGSSQPEYMAEAATSSKKTSAALLAFFLGGLGIHKFYLGYSTSGLIMLLVSLISCGLLALPIGIIALVEGVIYQTKSNEQFYEEYILNKKEWF